MSRTVPSIDWQVLYRAAVYEDDPLIRAKRITEAERVIKAKRQTLINRSTDAIGERGAMDWALYALHLLKQYTRDPFQ